MKLDREIIVTGSFVGFHCWSEAPPVVSYLSQLHRHIFYYKVFYKVEHNERHLEFHIEKERISTAVYDLPRFLDVSNWSCETWAEQLLDKIPEAYRAEIWEDNECGAAITKPVLPQ